MIFEWDDFGANHEISDKCQSHDCRDQLLRLKELNPDFKATLFAIPAEMTMELQQWCAHNSSWIELAVHGFLHSSNYECEKWTYEQMDNAMSLVAQMGVFTKAFRAPGWQISDECLRWLGEHDWLICDQGYNDGRRPVQARSYVNYDNQFKFYPMGILATATGDWKDVEAYHGHTWNVGWNGIYEDWDRVSDLVKNAEDFQFLSELV